MTRLAAGHARRAGIKFEPLLSRAGLTIDQIDDPAQRIARSQIAFLETIAEELNDDFLGLTLAKEFLLPGHLKITTTGVPDIVSLSRCRRRSKFGRVDPGLPQRSRIALRSACHAERVDHNRDIFAFVTRSFMAKPRQPKS